MPKVTSSAVVSPNSIRNTTSGSCRKGNWRIPPNLVKNSLLLSPAFLVSSSASVDFSEEVISALFLSSASSSSLSFRSTVTSAEKPPRAVVPRRFWTTGTSRSRSRSMSWMMVLVFSTALRIPESPMEANTARSRAHTVSPVSFSVRSLMIGIGSVRKSTTGLIGSSISWIFSTVGSTNSEKNLPRSSSTSSYSISTGFPKGCTSGSAPT